MSGADDARPRVALPHLLGVAFGRGSKVWSLGASVSPPGLRAIDSSPTVSNRFHPVVVDRSWGVAASASGLVSATRSLRRLAEGSGLEVKPTRKTCAPQAITIDLQIC